MDDHKDQVIESLAKENEFLRAELKKFKEAHEKIGKSKQKPVVVRGVTYESAKAVADALGVSINTVKSAKRRKALDTIGLGLGYKTPNAKLKFAEKKRKTISFEGCVFHGWAEATHITGLSRSVMLRQGAVVS